LEEQTVSMRIRDIAVGAAMLVVCAVVIVKPWTFLRRDLYRGEVRALYQSLRPGMTREQVAQVMDSGKFQHLTFDRKSPLWSGDAPYEFGAQSWVLLIEFQAQRVSALRVRTADGIGPQHHPAEAPPDKPR
jgi:hypothetical protein